MNIKFIGLRTLRELSVKVNKPAVEEQPEGET